MRKAKSLLGLNVISQLEGKNLGKVRDLILDDNSQRLVALLLSDKELFGMIDAVVIPFSQVREIGPHAIMVPNDEAVVKAHADRTIAQSFDQSKKLDGKKVTTQGGEDLGTISDLYIDADGNITGYEISGGIFSDAFSGKRYMEAPSEITMGEDVILVPANVVTELQRQKDQEPGGLTGAYRNAAQNVSTSTEGLSGKVNEFYASTVKPGYESARASLAESYSSISKASVEKQREFVIGKVAGRDVVIPSSTATMETPAALPSEAVENQVVVADGETLAEIERPTHAEATDITSEGEVVSGEVLVRQGEIITAEHADRAIAADVLGQLVLSAATNSASQAMNTGRTQVQNVATDGRTALNDAGTSAQGTIEKAAIGKPAAREVLAPDGTVLVAPGMIITPEILAQADVYGKKGEIIAVAGLGAATESLQQGYTSARESATSLWEQIKGKTTELTSVAQEKKAAYDARSEQNRINKALGRPVTRVILDRDDNVILNTGDIITNAAVDRARNSGVLEILLDSVADVQPQITGDMLRVQERGQAALSSQQEPPTAQVFEVTDPGEEQPARQEQEEYQATR